MATTDERQMARDIIVALIAKGGSAASMAEDVAKAYKTILAAIEKR
jgi:hypothetical protein